MITEETIARVKSSLQATKSFTALEVIEKLEKENAELKAQIKLIESVSDANADENTELKKQEEILLDRILTLQKTNGSLTDRINMLEEQIEKMKNIIYEEIDFCSYCPLKDCRNDEGVCPCANISKEEQVEILTEWITKNGS